MSISHENSKFSNPNHIDEQLCNKISESAGRVVNFLESKLQPDGSYSDAKDIACYFKSPMMFLAAGKPDAALAVLKHIKKTFMCSDGDFKTAEKIKSANQAYIEYWSYTNGWIVRAASLLKQADICNPGIEYLNKFKLAGSLGFLTNQPQPNSIETDVLTAAHHGLINLERNNIDVMIIAGNYLCEALSKQLDLKKGFYLRINNRGELITQFPKEKTPFYYVSTAEPNQLHFMIGYPSAYLAILYKKTNDPKYLKAAKAYLDFSLSCDASVYQCNFSHKIAWAASLVYECTGDKKYLEVIAKITDYFIKQQSNNGMWFPEDTNSSFDQSAEIACWFLDIAKNINSPKKKDNLEDAKKLEVSTHSSWTKNAIKFGAMALISGFGLYVLLRPKTNISATASSSSTVDIKRLNSIG